MKKMICFLLSVGLSLQPLLLLADETAAMPVATEEAAPELPVAVETSETLVPTVDPSAKAEVETPQGEPEAKTETVNVVIEKPKRFLWGNFLLGAAGGALISGVVAFVGFTRDDKNGSIDYAKAQVVVPVAVLGGAALGGLLSVLLGATTPPPATPPDMSQSLTPGLQASGNKLIYRVSF